MIRATKQIKAPNMGIHFTLFVFLLKRKLDKLTMANIIKKPELPIIEMLEISKRLATNSVIPDVINKPSIGLFQINLSRNIGNSPYFAIT